MTDTSRDRKSALHGESGYVRIDNDAYFTPAWCTEALLRVETFGPEIWEPAAGAWCIADVLKEAGHHVICSDLQDYGRGNVIHDFLHPQGARDVVIADLVTNPPYSCCNAFIARALGLMQPGGGKMALLLRAEFSFAKGREDFFRGNPHFKAKYELVDRPRWLTPVEGETGWEVVPISELTKREGDDSKTASPRHTFAWYVWDFSQEWVPTLGWLTEKEERQERLL